MEESGGERERHSDGYITSSQVNTRWEGKSACKRPDGVWDDPGDQRENTHPDTLEDNLYGRVVLKQKQKEWESGKGLSDGGINKSKKCFCVRVRCRLHMSVVWYYCISSMHINRHWRSTSPDSPLGSPWRVCFFIMKKIKMNVRNQSAGNCSVLLCVMLCHSADVDMVSRWIGRYIETWQQERFTKVYKNMNEWQLNYFPCPGIVHCHGSLTYLNRDIVFVIS